MSIPTDHDPRPYDIGDRVLLPAEFCPGCMDVVTARAGEVTGTVPDGDVHWKLAEEHPGPYFLVRESHVHGAGSAFVFAAQELRPGGGADVIRSEPRGGVDPERGEVDPRDHPRALAARIDAAKATERDRLVTHDEVDDRPDPDPHGDDRVLKLDRDDRRHP